MKKKVIAVFVAVAILLPIHALAEDDNTYYAVEKISEQEYTVYRNQLNAQLGNLQIDYLKKLEAQQEEKWKIAQEKLKLGYAVPIDVQEAESQYTAVQLQIETAEAQQEFYKEVIRLYGREYQEIQVPEELEPLQEDYVAQFLQNSAQQGINLEIYVKELMLNYENIRRNVTATDNQIAVLEGKIKNAKLLYEAGKIAKIQLTELETELTRLEYERMSLIYDAQAIYYILSNNIEGQEVP